jgi:hypothetical protein
MLTRPFARVLCSAWLAVLVLAGAVRTNTSRDSQFAPGFATREAISVGQHAPDDAPVRSTISSSVPGLGILWAPTWRTAPGNARTASTLHYGINGSASQRAAALSTHHAALAVHWLIAGVKSGRDANCTTSIPPPA